MCFMSGTYSPEEESVKKNLAKWDQHFKNIRRQNPFGVTFTSHPALTPFL